VVSKHNYVALEDRYRLRQLHSFLERHITPDATEELKLDGYRSLAIKCGGKVQLRSRNDHDFNRRYPGVVKALAPMPHETVI
jgi:ATP-dependent DNA ligase